MAPVRLLSTFSVSVAQVLTDENELEERWEVHVVTQLQAEKLQISQSVDMLVGQHECLALNRSVEMPSSWFLPQRTIQALELTIPAYLVIECFLGFVSWKRCIGSICGSSSVLMSVCQSDSWKKVNCWRGKQLAKRMRGRKKGDKEKANWNNERRSRRRKKTGVGLFLQVGV